MSSGLNKEWISSDKIDTTSYQSGLLDFFQFLIGKDGVEKSSTNRKKFYSCPCRSCCNKKGQVQCDDIISHLLRFGMDKSYTTWYYHGEDMSTNAPIPMLPTDSGKADSDQTSFPTSNSTPNDVGYEGSSTSVHDQPGGSETIKESKYERLKRLAQRPLFPPSQQSQHSTMDALLQVNELKNEFNLSNGSTEGILKMLKELLPMENSIGCTYHEMKFTLKESELSCISYDVCINNCMLFWKEHDNSTHCTKCHEPRYKSLRDTKQMNKSTRGGKRKRTRTAEHVPELKQVARKVMKYFPIIPRLKRLYGIEWIEKAMKWHAEASLKPSVEFMRHPCDSEEWRNVNRIWKSFSSNSRNVRLALAIDGFKPYGQFGASYSCWPVILQPLNLPPSLTMNSEFSMLTVLIPGKKGSKGSGS